MEFWSFIRNIFGGQNLEKPRNEGFFRHSDNLNDEEDKFHNSLWQNVVDDSDVNHRGCSVFAGNHFHIFSDPLEVAKYFESQMDFMLKTFMFGFNGRNTDAFPLPSPEGGDLRYNMLKPDGDQHLSKVDTDLDGKVSVDNFSDIYGKCDKSKPEMSMPHKISKFVSKKYVRMSDGIVQEIRVIKDGEGNEETTISKRIGDKVHTVVTNKDKSGIETKTETFVNMDEGELDKIPSVPLNEKGNFHGNLNYFPWKKFFDIDPKL